MRKVIAVSLLFVMIFALLGCANQTKDANKLIDKRNEHYKTAEEVVEELENLTSGMGQGQTVEEFKQEQDMLKDTKSKIEKAKKELSSGLDNLKEAKELDISSDFKTYIGMVISADSARMEMIDLLEGLIDEAVAFYDLVISNPNASAAELQPYMDKMKEYSEKLQDKEKEAKELDEKAKDYHEEKNLGGD